MQPGDHRSQKRRPETMTHTASDYRAIGCEHDVVALEITCIACDRPPCSYSLRTSLAMQMSKSSADDNYWSRQGRITDNQRKLAIPRSSVWQTSNGPRLRDETEYVLPEQVKY